MSAKEYYDKLTNDDHADVQPESVTEAYLLAMLDDAVPTPEGIRKDFNRQIYEALVNGDFSRITPQSRAEAYMLALYQKRQNGGGVSGPVSWNDLKDKPFGVSNNVLIPETVFEFTGSYFGKAAYTPDTFVPFVLGEEYSLIFDGVTYTAVSEYENSVSFYVTDYRMIKIESNAESSTYNFTDSERSNFSASISLIQEGIVKTLDEKFLPDSVKGGSGGPISWNDLTDKPFRAEDVLIEWDGDTNADDQVVIRGDEVTWFVKVSDITYTPEEMMCLSNGQVYNGRYMEAKVSELSYSGLSLNSDNTLVMFGTMMFVAYEANVTLPSGLIGKCEFTFPEKGTYFVHIKTSSQDTYITHLSGIILKQIDEKYIPDSLKTHGVIGTEDGEVVLEPVSVEGGTMLTDPFQITLEAGKTYSVAIDDDKYICECTVMQGGLVIGDGNAAMSPPFAILVMNGTVQVMISAAGTHTISVAECKEIVKTLDEKFLPDSVKGGGGVIVFRDHGLDASVQYTCDLSYEEALSMVDGDKIPVIVLIQESTMSGQLMRSKHVATDVVTMGDTAIGALFYFVQTNTRVALSFASDGTITLEAMG